MAVQILLRPTDGSWTKISTERTKNIKNGTAQKVIGQKVAHESALLVKDFVQAFWKPPEERKEAEKEPLSNLQLEEIAAIEDKTKHPGFETLIRVVASSNNKQRSETMLGGVVAAFSQFDSQNYNGFQYDMLKDMRKFAVDYTFRIFPQKADQNILNSVELASIFHLPSQSAIPTSQVERQATKQVDGPAKLVTEGVARGERISWCAEGDSVE